MAPAKKILVLVDGYNFYYALCDFVYTYLHKDRKFLWCDLFKVAGAYLQPGENIAKLCYCSAVYAIEETMDAHEKKKIEEQQRVQTIFMDYHRNTYGDRFKDLMGKFARSKPIYHQCPKCGQRNPANLPREKQTDVNIAVQMMAGAYLDGYTKIILISGDTDYDPAIKHVMDPSIPPQVEILRLLPPSPHAKFKHPTKQITGEVIQDACFADQLPADAPEPRRYWDDL